jgi:hypothetical protein
MEIFNNMSIPDIIGKNVFSEKRRKEIGQINKSFFNEFFGHQQTHVSQVLNEHEVCERLGVPGTFLSRINGLPVKSDRENQTYIHETELIEWFYENFLPKG